MHHNTKRAKLFISETLTAADASSSSSSFSSSSFSSSSSSSSSLSFFPFFSLPGNYSQETTLKTSQTSTRTDLDDRRPHLPMSSIETSPSEQDLGRKQPFRTPGFFMVFAAKRWLPNKLLVGRRLPTKSLFGSPGGAWHAPAAPSPSEQDLGRKQAFRTRCVFIVFAAKRRLPNKLLVGSLRFAAKTMKTPGVRACSEGLGAAGARHAPAAPSPSEQARGRNELVRKPSQPDIATASPGDAGGRAPTPKGSRFFINRPQESNTKKHMVETPCFCVCFLLGIILHHHIAPLLTIRVKDHTCPIQPRSQCQAKTLPDFS